MLPDNNSSDDDKFALPARKDKVLQPLHQIADDDKNLAISLIRQKLDTLYEKEPNAKKELSEAESLRHRSKHQQYMHELSKSGKSLAEIQTAWHNYYIGLPDAEKHKVWQEFYANYNRQDSKVSSAKHEHAVKASPASQAIPHTKAARPANRDTRTVKDVKNQLIGKVSKQAAQRSHHRKSLAFGLSVGAVTILIMLFGFFNERFIAPFITPSRTLASTPIILDSNTAVGPEPKIIIPKINVDIPVVYDEPSTNEAAVQRALEKGVLHYAITPKPGEKGNAAIFGHSSNNILNSGKFKFAFVLLNRLEEGDTFFIQKDGVRYTYRVFEKKIVEPSDTSVLLATEKPATVSLITCDPPGTSIHRLVVIGEQISPNPSGNQASSVDPGRSTQPAILPSNAPSLWSRFWNWLTN